MAKPRAPLRPGVYSPTMTFFHPDTEDLDVPTIRKHAVRLAKAGLVGLVTMGSNGEAVHLTREERKTVTRETRAALDEAGYQNVPVITGASEQSIRGTIELTKEAAQAGAEYVLIVPPSYYRYAVGNDESLYEFFTSVADESPVPVILYNYPGAVAGIDMDSDLIIRISQHPNIVGTKFTCANTGKLTRVAHALNAITPPSPFENSSKAPSKSTKTAENHPYVAFGGIADFTLQTLISGGSAIIAGGANVLPRTCVQIFNLWSRGRLAEAVELQKVLSAGDWVLTKSAIPGTKSAIQTFYGYGGFPRRPLRRLSEASVKTIADGLKEVMDVEFSLPDLQ
jgi:L-threo-3-deoxy-hexylosonate aldolase